MSPIEFDIQGAGEEYTDLSQTQLYVGAKIVCANGDDLPDGEKVGPTNLWLHSLFQQIDVSLGNKIVTDSTNTYPYRAYFENLLNYGEDAKQTQLTSALFYQDTPGRLHMVDPFPTAPNAVVNTGLVKRATMTRGSREVDLIGPLHVDLFFQDRYLLNKVDMKIKLHRSKHQFNLMSPEQNKQYKVVITGAALFLRKGNHTVSNDNLFLGQIPKRLAIALGTRSVACSGLERDSSSSRALCRYATRKLGQDSGNQIARDAFDKGYAIYCYDLSPDLCGLGGDHFNVIKQGNLRLELHFAKALEQTAEDRHLRLQQLNMDTKQIYSVLESDENTAPIARGVFAADQLPTNVPDYPSAYVVNTDDSGKPGQHWLALYFDDTMRGEFFDSYGRAPKDYPRSIELFLRRNSRLPWIRNEPQFIEEHFNIDVPVVDLSHIMSQVARALEDVCHTLR
ncbi:hypothetical protein Bbelb_235090 [Branchiostoma belcheri]|nr:hypothetical protein Bbelb_235090 [Branchiostoma belcheri]